MTRHPSSQRFHELLVEAGELHDRKQADYGTEQDPFANIRGTEEWGMSAHVGAFIRMDDKMRRLKALVRNGKLANESVEDSLRDIAVYALIALVMIEEDAGAADVVPEIPALDGRQLCMQQEGQSVCIRSTGHTGAHSNGHVRW